MSHNEYVPEFLSSGWDYSNSSEAIKKLTLTLDKLNQGNAERLHDAYKNGGGKAFGLVVCEILAEKLNERLKDSGYSFDVPSWQAIPDVRSDLSSIQSALKNGKYILRSSDDQEDWRSAASGTFYSFSAWGADRIVKYMDEGRMTKAGVLQKLVNGWSVIIDVAHSPLLQQNAVRFTAGLLRSSYANAAADTEASTLVYDANGSPIARYRTAGGDSLFKNSARENAFIQEKRYLPEDLNEREQEIQRQLAQAMDEKIILERDGKPFNEIEKEKWLESLRDNIEYIDRSRKERLRDEDAIGAHSREIRGIDPEEESELVVALQEGLREMGINFGVQLEARIDPNNLKNISLIQIRPSPMKQCSPVSMGTNTTSSIDAQNGHGKLIAETTGISGVFDCTAKVGLMSEGSADDYIKIGRYIDDKMKSNGNNIPPEVRQRLPAVGLPPIVIFNPHKYLLKQENAAALLAGAHANGMHVAIVVGPGIPVTKHDYASTCYENCAKYLGENAGIISITEVQMLDLLRAIQKNPKARLRVASDGMFGRITLLDNPSLDAELDKNSVQPSVDPSTLDQAGVTKWFLGASGIQKKLQSAIDASTALSTEKIGGITVHRACIVTGMALIETIRAAGGEAYLAVKDDASIGGRDCPEIRDHVVAVLSTTGGDFVLDVANSSVTPKAQEQLHSAAIQKDLLGYDEASQTYTFAGLLGTFKDAAGKRHPVTFADFQNKYVEYRRRLESSGIALKEDVTIDRVALAFRPDRRHAAAGAARFAQ